MKSSVLLPLRHRLAIVCLGLVLAVAAASPSPAAPQEYQVLSQRPDRLIVTLPNRMIVVAQRVSTSPVVSVQGWVKTGSIYEQEHVGAGLSHFLEHLVSGGTTDTRTEVESNGILGRMGAQTNAATGLDTVRYYINTTREHADTAIDLLSDWLANASISDEEYQRERDVIQREFEMGRADPGRIFWKLTQQARYRAHPARHPTIGYLDEFKTISRDEIYGFFKRMYVPNNLVFVVAGDIDPQETVDRIASNWKAIPTGELPKLRFPIEGELAEAKFVTGHADIDRPRLRIAFPGTRLTGEHDYAMDLLAQVLGQGELSRLTRAVRDEAQLVTSISSYNLSFSWGEGFFGVDATTTAEQMDEAREAIFAQIDRLIANGIEPDELARAKRKTIASVVYAAQTAEGLASRLAGDIIHTGDPDYLQRYAKAIEGISADELLTAARVYLKRSRAIEVRLMPTDAEPTNPSRPPEPDDLGDMAYEAVQLDNTRLIGLLKKAGSEQRETMAAPEVEPVRMIRLDNGLRLLVQRNTQLPIVAMQWYHLGGLLADQPGREGVANAMSQMMIRGAGELTAEQIAARLEDLGAQLSTQCGNSTFYATSQCLSDDWPQVLEIMSDVIQKPNFSAAEWEKMQPRLLAAIDSLDDSWYGELRSRFREAYFGLNHPWSQQTLGRRDVVESLTVEQLRAFHGDHLSADRCVLAVFGDVDVKQVTAAVKALFGSMPKQAVAQLPKPYPHEGADHIHAYETAKPVVGVQIGYGPGMARSNPDYAPTLVMTRVLSSFPTGWLEQELRGRGPGLVYAVGAFQATGAVPGYWAAVFNTQPATAHEAIDRARGVIDRIRTEPIDAATLERARNAALVREALGSQSNSQRAASVALDELYGVGQVGPSQLIEQIRQVTPADIQRVAKTYLAEPVIVAITPNPDELTKEPEPEPAEQATE